MDVEKPPPWSGKQLKRLGQALVAPGTSSEEYPAYEDVMAWHGDLADEVSSQIESQEWSSKVGAFDVSSRAKTVDTLREKLIRETNLKLNQVQDIAGVRVDIDGHLGVQTAFCEELADFFGGEGRAVVKDIRQQPHSGYRAVHVWLRLPAGRVEIQVRTRYQSAWANVYERLGDLFGRQIRYGGVGDGTAEQVVTSMHILSNRLRSAEELQLESLLEQERVPVPEAWIEAERADEGPLDDERLRELRQARQAIGREREALDQLLSAVANSLAVFLDGMSELRRSLDEIELSEAGE